MLVVDRRVDGDLLLDDRVDAVAGADGLALEQLLRRELAARADLLGPDRPPLVGERDQVAEGEGTAAQRRRRIRTISPLGLVRADSTSRVRSGRRPSP
jgi:hypothetical protein